MRKRISFQEFQKRLDRGTIPPLVFLDGEESYLAGKACALIAEKLAARPEASGPGVTLDRDVFDGKSLDGSEVVSAASQVSMFSGAGLIIVKDADRMSAKNRGLIQPYLKRHEGPNVLVFLAAKPDMRTTFFKELIETAVTVACGRLSRPELSRWIRGIAESNGCRVTDGAVEELLSWTDASLYEIESEIEKAVLMKGGADTGRPCVIDKAVIEEVGCVYRKVKPWALNDPLGERNLAKALKVYADMADSNQSAIGTLYSVRNHFERLYQAKRACTGRSSALPRDHRERFWMEKLQAQARGFSEDELLRVLDSLFWAEVDLKGQGLSDRTVMEMLIYDICGVETVPERAASIPGSDTAIRR